MDTQKIEKQLERYKEAIIAIKARTGLKSVRRIAAEINYSRGETISEYGNIKHYKPQKFRDFIYLLARVFEINPDYVLEGKGPIFRKKSDEPLSPAERMTPAERKQKIESLEYCKAVFEQQLTRLREIHNEPGVGSAKGKGASH